MADSVQTLALRLLSIWVQRCKGTEYKELTDPEVVRILIASSLILHTLYVYKTLDISWDCITTVRHCTATLYG